eukprot:12409327-Karenia_brevis.AAC.1
MRIKEWPNTNNEPVLHVNVDHQCQATKHSPDWETQQVWQGDIVVGAPTTPQQKEVLDPTHFTSSTNI